MEVHLSLETASNGLRRTEAVETAARELARIRKIDGAARLMPARAYGELIERDAIAKSLTLAVSAQKDRHLAACWESLSILARLMLKLKQ